MAEPLATGPMTADLLPGLTKALSAGQHDCAPRVLFVVPGDGSGASMIFIRRQIDSLRAAGVIPRDFFLSTRTSPGRLLRERHRFRQAVREFSPDLVHAQYGTMTACFCLMSTRLPVVVTFRGSDLNPCRSISLMQSLGGRLLSQIAAQVASEVVCVSEPLRRRVCGRRSVHIIPSGVDTNLFYPRARSQARRELGWPLDERVILFNSGSDPVTKGVCLARTAVDNARGLLEGIRLEVLNGHVPPIRIPTYLNAADCLLVTSLFEGSPNIVKEALACNLPIVSLDVGDVQERLQGVTPSEIVRADADEIARALVRILSSPTRSNGFSRAVEISTAAMAGKLLEVYRSVLRRKPPSTRKAAAA